MFSSFRVLQPLTVDGASASGRLQLRQRRECRVRPAPQQASREGPGPDVEPVRDCRPGWPTPSPRGSRGRICIRRMWAPGGIWYSTADGSSRRSRLSPRGPFVRRPPRRCPKPRVDGPGQNWDYRYSWVRDTSFTIEALWVAACPDEANEFFDYMTTSAAGAVKRGQRPADHVRHRWRTGPHRAGTAEPGGLAQFCARTGRQRRLAPAPTRRLWRAAQRRPPALRPPL